MRVKPLVQLAWTSLVLSACMASKVPGETTTTADAAGMVHDAEIAGTADATAADLDDSAASEGTSGPTESFTIAYRRSVPGDPENASNT